MTPYPHPASHLAVFKVRLSADTGLDDASYQLQCGRPCALTAPTDGDDCQDWSKVYNTEVDVEASGAIEGVVCKYPYNRIDIGKLALPQHAFTLYLNSNVQTTIDLLPEFNRRSGLQLDPLDVEALPVTTAGCNCGCGPIGVVLKINPDSLLYTGEVTLYMAPGDIPISELLRQPFLPPIPLPALTPV